ncbi:MAG: S41 family peptidase [Bacteroidetes bacterium]|mgnify:CR=1 FL=1|nr:MAG: S41 family peptidase [Bacteroidota bacterium]REK04745.1 MAG: S41 family peptidase [Bacteroidota bacterium]REK36219.1 MAG: S41 family peptidase [Bacteroidota bacterium]REK51119.1 MAG: S41 family peptidase [Bacteroidota bacterium]
MFSAVLVLGIFVGIRLNEPYKSSRSFFSFKTGQFNKINDVINYINNEYVDTVNQKSLIEKTISDMLHALDPHSAYIPADELQAMTEPLEGNFDGIGIEFHIQEDTIMVVSAVHGGPSEQLGIQSGDRIIKVEDSVVTGIGITNPQVMQLLRGPSGTKVNVTVYRKSTGKTIQFAITRGKIPIYSVDVAFMLTPETGYIKVGHFAEKTHDEYLKGFMKLKDEGMQNLVLDLRGNPGGYLKAAIQLADEFLPEKKLIVYTEGRSRPRESFYATQRGYFDEGAMVVLIDEGSASASEIVAGALQDWDRATILGRRSFGKGLVQEQSQFPDGSAIRLTIARYYTPTGRSIQKPYQGGYEQYSNELFERLKKGELLSSDSIRFDDSLHFVTPGGKLVYGGGGIMPDFFIPLDTSASSSFYSEVSSKGLISQFAYDYMDQNREYFRRFKTFEEYNQKFTINDEIFRKFLDYVQSNGVNKEEKGIKISGDQIRIQLKALLARQIWKNDGFFPVILTRDNTVKQALELIEKKQVAVKGN